MRTLRLPLLVALALSLSATVAHAGDPSPVFAAQLDGSSEVPIVLSQATGTFKIHLSDRQPPQYVYDLQYSGLRGNVVVDVTLQLGLPGQNGGTVAILCASQLNALGPPLCPNSGKPGTANGELHGEFRVASMMTADAIPQWLIPGDVAAFADALAAGQLYVNVRTDVSPHGEIRGQILPIH